MNNKYLAEIFGLKKQIAVITGGLGKLGSEFTEAILKVGGKVATVDIADVPKGRLKKLSKKYPLLFIKADITDEKEIENSLKIIKKKFGSPTILINNASWKASPNDPKGAGKPFEKYSIDLWDRVFAVNLKGAAICSKIFGGEMIARKRGVIINIVSHYALVSADNRIYNSDKSKKRNEMFFKDPSYSSSKAGLIAMTRDLATQWAPFGVRVVALALGGVFNPKSKDDFVKNYSYKVPLGRMADKSEYNGMILFLASRASSYITGTTIVADGGWTAW